MCGAGNKGHKGGSAQTHAQVFKADNQPQQPQSFADPGENCKAQDGDYLNQPEQPEGAINTYFQHQYAAENTANNHRPERRVFCDQADLGHAETHIQVEGGGQCSGHAVSQFIEQHKGQDQ